MEMLHPGVYLQEVSSGARPIEGVSTSTAAFVGRAEMGPLNVPTLVTTFSEYTALFGGYLSDSYLTHAVSQFFNNGGRKCYVLRITHSGASADIVITDRGGEKSPPAQAQATLTVAAANMGTWGNELDVVVTNGTLDPANEFNLSIYRDQSASGSTKPPVLLERFDDLSMDPDAKNYVEKACASSKYIVATADPTNVDRADRGASRSGTLPVSNGAIALRLGAANGGAEAAGQASSGDPGQPATPGTSVSALEPSTNPAADQRGFLIQLDGDAETPVTFGPTAATGPDIAASIQAAVRRIRASAPAKQLAYDEFTCSWESSQYVLSSGTTGPNSTVVIKDLPGKPLLESGDHRFWLTLDGDGPHQVSLAGPFASGDLLADAIAASVGSMVPKRHTNQAAFEGFTCTYVNDNAAAAPFLELRSGTATPASSARVSDASGSSNAAPALKLGVANGGTETTGAATLRPQNSVSPQTYAGETDYHLGDAQPSLKIKSVAAGDDGSALDVPQDYEAAVTVGASPFDHIRDMNILCVPGVGDASLLGLAANYCRQRMDCFFIGDLSEGDAAPEKALQRVRAITKNSYAAVYYPWLKMSDPARLSPVPVSVPPSGFVAGIYAQTDTRRGVWKAPAGTEALVAGITGLVTDTTDAQQDFLNPVGVNVIRSFPASGTVIWGARTLATASDPEYRYIPVRRTAIFLEQSIYAGIQWAVFEPNDDNLWASLRFNVGAFMMRQFRAGAFQGRTPSDAYFVACDAKTTTQADIDAGVVNILVAFAPLKPAEFVVLRLTQKVGGLGV